MDRRVFVALIILLVAAPGLSSLGAGAPPSPSYQIEDLGTTLDGLVPTVTGINASGQVSGSVTTSAGLRAVRYTNGAGWSYVPGLEGVFSTAAAINANGDLTGQYRPTPLELRAYRYVDGVGVMPIGVLPGGTFTQGMSISANGEVVGNGDSTGGPRAWRTGPGYGTLPFVPDALTGITSSTCGVNAIGQMVGSFTPGSSQHAYRLETNGTVTDIGTLGGATSSACGLDADGRVGGQSRVSTTTTDTHAFVFFAGAPSDVHTFVSAFSTIISMANGVGVGSFNFTPTLKHAFVHTAAGGAIDLNNAIPAGSSWVLTDARAISSNGQIVGPGTLAGVPRVYRLTPSAAADTTAPVIASASASPSSVTPPNKLLVDVAFSAAATDDQDPSPVCAASAVDGHGAPSADFSITGPLSGRVRATGGAVYSFTISCTDAAGNASSRSVDVTVPPDNTVPVITSLFATPSTIWPPKGQMVTVTTTASATDDSGETPTCTLDSITGPGTSPADFSVTGANTGSVKAVGGRIYSFRETCVDGSGNGAWSSVTVTVPADVTAPVIAALTATPSSVGPPNGAMVPVALSVSATDDVDDAPVCALAGITSAGAPAGDFAIAGPLSATVRAVGGRTYSLRVACSDAAGNSRDASVDVVVPADTTAPVITALSASPDHIWPPNGKMEQVTLSVTATDNVDAAPQCSLTSITGAPAGSFAILGALTANVRSDRDNVYTLNVTCKDKSLNAVVGSVSVKVTKDSPVAAASGKK